MIIIIAWYTYLTNKLVFHIIFDAIIIIASSSSVKKKMKYTFPMKSPNVSATNILIFEEKWLLGDFQTEHDHDF